MNNKKAFLGIAALMLVFFLAACGGNDKTSPSDNADPKSNTHENRSKSDNSDSMEGMDHSGSGEVPEGLAMAENPSYPVGSKVIIHADHMPGMEGAEATVSGAFDTTVYSVTYTPTTGGKPVKNHKWVVHEEIKNAGDKPYKSGEEVVLNAEHMKGMKGAKATIDTAEQTTVYMVDYTDTKTGEKITKHMWVTESELSPVK
ncbi:YdhK family protein [Neobacillus mesonae]|uniref:YdhK family protein n=1 Tax=Neobacillus mesonae TaxID=1193713 RepID=UPI00257276AE|nr:YdhK family protein [Neobacillus mesonae]